VEAIHRARSFGGDATVLADYALTTTTHLQNLGNLEKSGNLRVVREKSGKKARVRESVFLHMVSYRKMCKKGIIY